MKEIDCQVFQDQLDSLVEGSLSDEGMRQLRLHAAVCSECAMSLRVLEHLVSPSLQELEAQVPEDLLSSVWGGVEARLEGAGSGTAHVAPIAQSFGKAAAMERADDVPAETSGQRDPRRVRGRLGSPTRTWLVPTLAAASIALLFATGGLLLQVRRTEAHNTRLAQQVQDLERGLADLGTRTRRVEETTGILGRNGWIRSLSTDLGGGESVTIGSIESLLRQLAPDTPLLTAPQVETLLRAVSGARIPAIRTRIAATSGSGGLTAGELLALLASLDLDPDRTVPTSRLRDLLT